MIFRGTYEQDLKSKYICASDADIGTVVMLMLFINLDVDAEISPKRSSGIKVGGWVVGDIFAF